MTSKLPVPSVLEDPTHPQASSDFLNRPEFNPALTTKKQRITLLLVLLFVLAVMAAAGTLGYRYHLARHAKAVSANAAAQVPAADPYAGWKTYTSTADHFSIKYPSTWTLDTTNAPYNQVGYDAATLTSPSKTVLNLYANTGGKGGWCTPGPQDVPFKAGNACATLEYLTSEELPISNLYYKAEVPNSDPVKYVPERASAYLVTTHFADQAGEPTYGISIAEIASSEDAFELSKPYMGAVVPYTWLTVYDASGQFLPYIYVYTNSTSPSFLTSDDAATIKSIIRSFSLDI